MTLYFIVLIYIKKSIVSFFLPSCIINGTLVFLHYVLVGNPGIVFLLLQHKNLQPADVDFFTI